LTNTLCLHNDIDGLFFLGTQEDIGCRCPSGYPEVL
jgi:hypothetical protein